MERAAVATHVRLGFVSIERAASDYGVVVDQATYEVDEGATRRLRSAGAS